MDAVQTALRRIRNWFLVWFIAEAAAGTAVAAYVLERMGLHSLLRYSTGGVGATGTIVSGIVVSLVLLLLGLALLEALEARRPWARTVMLVVGWITIVSAALNLAMLPGAAELLGSVIGITRADWPALAAVSLLTTLGDLVYWGWVVFVLQMNGAVREAFLCSASLPAEANPSQRARP